MASCQLSHLPGVDVFTEIYFVSRNWKIYSFASFFPSLKITKNLKIYNTKFACRKFSITAILTVSTYQFLDSKLFIFQNNYIPTKTRSCEPTLDISVIVLLKDVNCKKLKMQIKPKLKICFSVASVGECFALKKSMVTNSSWLIVCLMVVLEV